MNERICASALYYYDSENITESSLAFRQRVDDDEFEMKAYEQVNDGLPARKHAALDIPPTRIKRSPRTTRGIFYAFFRTMALSQPQYHALTGVYIG